MLINIEITDEKVQVTTEDSSGNPVTKTYVTPVAAPAAPQEVVVPIGVDVILRVAA